MMLMIFAMLIDIVAKLCVVLLNVFIGAMNVMELWVRTIQRIRRPPPRTADNDAGQWPGTQQGINDHLNRFEQSLGRRSR